MKTFEGKVMLITGAAQGIGERVAELAAAQGARLALVDRSPLVQDVRARLESVTEVLALEVDLEQFDGAQQAAAILFLASDQASYITGTVLPVGGGDQG